MPVPFHTYDFDDGASSSLFATSASNASIQFTDDSVNFTWSVFGAPFQLGHYSGGGGSLAVSSLSGSDGLILDVTGATGTATPATQFFGSTANPISIQVGFVSGTFWATFLTASGGFFTQTITTGNVGSPITAVGQFTGISFYTPVSGGSISITSIAATINCFLEGTRVATPSGEDAVETLEPGDVITTADGGTTTVKWVGQQDIATRFVMPEKVNPICIKAAALAEGVPSRDLYMTGDHALLIDGLLINASCLTNGRSIYQVEKMPMDGFSYYHVETDAHELLVAEGVAAETFIDYVGRDTFQNADEHSEMYPELPPIAEMDLPRISAKRLVPEQVRTHLNTRAKMLFPTRQPKRAVAA